MELVSLIFPVYNVVSCVKESLLSALNQSYTAIEYIIVDDKGTDNSMEIVRDLVNSNKRKDSVRIVEHKINIGAGATRNTGIREARGKYIFFMDSDDILPENAISTLIDACNDNYDMIAGSFERISHTEKMIIKGYDEIINSKKLVIKSYFRDKKWTEQCWGKLYSVNFLRTNNITCIENCNHEDTPFMFHLCLKAKKIKLISDIIYCWIFRDGSITSHIKEKNIIDWYAGFEYMLNLAKKEKYPEIITYLNNFRLGPIWLLLKNKVVTNRKEELLRGYTVKLLSLSEIVKYQFSIKEKTKHIIFLLPFKIKLFILNIISLTQK